MLPKRESLQKVKYSETDKEIEKQVLTAKKTHALKLTNLNLKVWPKQVSIYLILNLIIFPCAKIFTIPDLKILDLSYNNIEEIPPEVQTLKGLSKLYLNNNPLQSVPIEISECRFLTLIDLSDTYVKWLPREMARMKLLAEIRLERCPIASVKLQKSYQEGINSMSAYFQRKLDRSIYREKLAKYLKEWVYVTKSYDEIQNMLEIVLRQMKDFQTPHLKRLLRNAQYVFPKDMSKVKGYEVRDKLLESFKDTMVNTVDGDTLKQ